LANVEENNLKNRHDGRNNNELLRKGRQLTWETRRTSKQAL